MATLANETSNKLHPRVYNKERECVLLSYVACNRCMRFSKSMIFTNNIKFTVYIAGTAGKKVSHCIVHTMKYHTL